MSNFFLGFHQTIRKKFNLLTINILLDPLLSKYLHGTSTACIPPVTGAIKVIMKRTIFAILALVSASIASSTAINYTGNISFTVTGLSTPGIHGLSSVGETFTGSYSYESNTGTDGVFDPSSGNLMFDVNLPGLGLNETSSDLKLPILSVSGGTVASLKTLYRPLSGYSFYLSSSKWNASSLTTNLIGFPISLIGVSLVSDGAKGTISYSNPLAQDDPITSVPDGGSTALLIGLVIGGLGLARKRLK